MTKGQSLELWKIRKRDGVEEIDSGTPSELDTSRASLLFPQISPDIKVDDPVDKTGLSSDVSDDAPTPLQSNDTVLPTQYWGNFKNASSEEVAAWRQRIEEQVDQSRSDAPVSNPGSFTPAPAGPENPYGSSSCPAVQYDTQIWIDQWDDYPDEDKCVPLPSAELKNRVDRLIRESRDWYYKEDRLSLIHI